MDMGLRLSADNILSGFLCFGVSLMLRHRRLFRFLFFAQSLFWNFHKFFLLLFLLIFFFLLLLFLLLLLLVQQLLTDVVVLSTDLQSCLVKFVVFCLELGVIGRENSLISSHQILFLFIANLTSLTDGLLSFLSFEDVSMPSL